LPLSALPSDPAEPTASELNRLLEISTRLTGLNETLRNELADSRRNSAELQSMLMTSRAELEQLKRELGPLRTHSTELLQAAENSEQELNGLRTALRQAETSLTSLEQSWSAYRTETELKLTRYERRTRIYKYGVIAGIVLALGGWTAFAVRR
jgi:predicted  nucleic acid-binding Zn-ribbon protein